MADINAQKNTVLNMIVLGVFAFAAFYLYGSQIKNKAVFIEKKNQEMKRQAFLREIGDYDDKISSYTRVLSSRSASDVMTAISSIAERRGVKILSFRPALEQKYPEYTKTPFYLELTVVGYHMLGQFISEIESLPDVYVVETLSVRNAVQADQQEIMTVMLTVGIISAAT